MADSGGYDVEFLEVPPEDYECLVCLLVLREPQMVSCCGVKFCKRCIDRVIQAGKPCPHCKDESFRYMAEKQLHRRILDLKVKCYERKKGCNWEGELRQLQKHHGDRCPYEEIECKLGCGEHFQRQCLESHEMDECSRRPTEAKLLSLTRKLESRMEVLEVKCSKQENEITILKEEVVALKEQNGKQYEDVKVLRESLKEATTVHHTELVQSLKAIEGELIRRCFTFSICVSIEDSSWVSPPFYSHHRGYLLQLTANMQKFSSIIHQLTYSIFKSGSTTDKGPIILSLNILPQYEDENNLDWPVYVTVDVLILSNIDKEANGLLHTLSSYRRSQDVERSIGASSDTATEGCIIGHAQYSFSCRIVVVRINFGPDAPLEEKDHPPKFSKSLYN